MSWANPTALTCQVVSIIPGSCRDEVLERETAGMPHAQAKELSTVSKAHLDVLVRLGLLARQSSDRFSFAIPGLGPLMKTIADGRKVRPCSSPAC